MKINDSFLNTPIIKIDTLQIPNLYVKREDLIPFSFGGNKARKAALFFDDFDSGDHDCMVTYGTSHSNHCRIIANICAAREIPCHIIAPEEVSDRTYNSDMTDLFGASITTVPVAKVHDTIEAKLDELKRQGYRPYFIAGGGHGDIGTEAYIECYKEICEYEEQTGIHFDHIFFASGTGTTQAGLVCGQILRGDDRQIVGMSIARKNPYGRDVVLQSIYDYLDHKGISYKKDEVEKKTAFIDDYTGEGYGTDNKDIEQTIRDALIRYGMPLDATYTGKAFFGMEEYVRKNGLNDKCILFIHTGGIPLFFDELKKLTGKDTSGKADR